MAISDRHPSDAPPPIPPHPKSIAGKVTARLPSTFSLPTSSLLDNPLPKQLTIYPAEWLSKYRAFVRANSSQVSSIESALRSVTYILPGRFTETPLTSEAVYTSLTLLTAFHTNLLRPDPTTPSTKRLSPQARYERWCHAVGGTVYTRANALLRTIQYTQLLCEMFAKRSGEKVRWRVVVFLELVKAICRVLMSRMTGWRPVIASGMGAESQERITDEPTEDGDDVPPVISQEGEEAIPNININTSGDSGYASDATEYKMPRTGLLLPTQLPGSLESSSASPLFSASASSISDYLSRRALTADELKPAPRLVHQLQTRTAQLAELLYIIRPVIYALALQHVASSSSSAATSSSARGGSSSSSNNTRAWKHAWTPWLLGLGIELLSRQLGKQDITSHRPGGSKSLSIVEREEAGRRRWWPGMGWWVLRAGFYGNVSRGLLEGENGVVARLKGIPLAGEMVAGVVEDYAWLWDEMYFSSATL